MIVFLKKKLVWDNYFSSCEIVGQYYFEKKNEKLVEEKFNVDDFSWSFYRNWTNFQWKRFWREEGNSSHWERKKDEEKNGEREKVLMMDFVIFHSNGEWCVHLLYYLHECFSPPFSVSLKDRSPQSTENEITEWCFFFFFLLLLLGLTRKFLTL